MRFEVQSAAEQVAFQLRMLQYSGLSTDQVQARSNSVIDNFISWLQNNSAASTGLPPVFGGGGQFTELTGTNQPFVGLLSTIQH